MNGREFELLVKRLFEKDLKKSFQKKIPIEHQKKVETKDGYNYKLDLYYVFRISNIEYENLIECKYWNQNVDRDMLNIVHSKINDLQFHKGIIVTNKGFQKGAIQFAKKHKMALVKVIDGKELEYVQHFDGGMATLEKELLPSNDKRKIIRPAIKGLITPKRNIHSFIEQKYGKEIAEFLAKDELENYMDMGASELPKGIEEQFDKMPIDFLEEYIKIETCGLPLKLSNENELRMISGTVYLLKVSQMSSERFRNKNK